MKTIRHTFFPISFGLFASLPALAIEPPKDDAPPPPSVKTPASAATTPDRSIIEAPPVQSKNAFIGLITADVPEMLSAHLGLKPGDGIMIRDLAPGGPAEKAGFARFDVITRVAGESVGSPAELSQKIATKTPGEEISVDLIHEGKPEVKTVQLGTRPAEAGRVADPRQLGHLNLGDMPGDQAQRIREMIEGRLNGQMSEPEAEPKAGRGNFHFNSNATFRLMDNDGSVEMKSSDGSKDITVRDHGNNVTWSGPWNTEQDKAAAPAEVRERIQRFKFDDNFRGNGPRFKLGPNGPDAGTDE
jgi:hypothetical protein